MRALGPLGRLADRLRHLARLAGAVADAALLVAHHDQCGEGETPTALHHLGDAVDGDQLVDQSSSPSRSRSRPDPPAAVSRFTCHVSCSSERQPALASGIGQRLDAAVIQIGATIEHDLFHARREAVPPPACRPPSAALSAPVLQPLAQRPCRGCEAAASVRPALSSITWARCACPSGTPTARPSGRQPSARRSGRTRIPGAAAATFIARGSA